jgi:hypothetical protein
MNQLFTSRFSNRENRVGSLRERTANLMLRTTQCVTALAIREPRSSVRYEQSMMNSKAPDELTFCKTLTTELELQLL